MAQRLTTILLKRFQIPGHYLLAILAIFVGLATGLGAIGFILLIQYFNKLFFGLTDQILTEKVSDIVSTNLHFWLPLIPMVGGLLVGPIVYNYASEARGHGVPEVMNAVARLGGIIRPRVAVAKSVASAICIGSGGSAGREGPIVQIGAALGSTIGQMFRMSGERVKVLVGCGAAAGISAVFNAPMAGVLFSLEIILGDFAIKTFGPVILSSVFASVVTRSYFGDHPAFAVPAYSLSSAWEIPLYMVMGIVLGAIAVSFTLSLDRLEDVFERFKLPNWTKPGVGGLLLGILAIFYPQILADGYDTIRLTLFGNMTVWILVVLVFAKMLATGLTLGSGNSGGIFAPSLFMGAAAGGAFGVLVNYLFPGVTATPGAYALVGMAGMVAGATHAPITAMLIVFEMTSDYRIILPLMVTVVLSTLVASKLCRQSVYTIKLFHRGIDLMEGKDVNILRSHKVYEVMDRQFETIDASMTLHDIFRTIQRSRDTYFIVKNSGGRMLGVLSFQDIRNVMSEHTLDYLVIAADLVVPETVSLKADDDLRQAYKMFSQRDHVLLPVVANDDSDEVIGVVRREHLIDYYHKLLIATLRS